MARHDPEEPFTYKTRSEQRLEWLKTRGRPLTDAEADELYACLHAIYQRDWRAHRARQVEREQGRFARDAAKVEDAKLIKKVLLESVSEEWR